MFFFQNAENVFDIASRDSGMIFRAYGDNEESIGITQPIDEA